MHLSNVYIFFKGPTNALGFTKEILLQSVSATRAAVCSGEHKDTSETATCPNYYTVWNSHNICYSFVYYPENDHTSGRNMSVFTV